MGMNEPAYDPVNDEILNCEPGTYAYWHEERHRQQYKQPGKLDRDARRVVMAFNMATLLSIGGGIAMSMMKQFWHEGALFFIAGIGAGYAGVWLNTLMMEIDAHVYAIRRWLREKH